MSGVKTLKSGKLFDLIADNICHDFLKKSQIRFMTVKKDGNILVYTNVGITSLIKKHHLRKWKMNYLINKIKKCG